MYHAIVMCDADGMITYWDDMAEHHFGYLRAEVINRPVATIVPEEFRDRHLDGVDRAMSGGERHLVGAATHLPVLHADGNIVCHAARFNHILTADDQLIAAVATFGPAAPDQLPWSPVTVEDAVS